MQSSEAYTIMTNAEENGCDAVPVHILTYRQQYIICSSSSISHVAETQLRPQCHQFQPVAAHLTCLPDSCVKQFAPRHKMALIGNPVKVDIASLGCLSAWKYVMVSHQNNTLPCREWSDQFGNETSSLANIASAVVWCVQ